MDQENVEQTSVSSFSASNRLRESTQYQTLPSATLTPICQRWAQRVVLVSIALGFAALLFITVQIFREAPPIPDRVTAPDGTVLFTGKDIRQGQQVFLKYGLLDNTTILARGPNDSDSSSEPQNTPALHGAMRIAQQRYGLTLAQLSPEQRTQIAAEVSRELTRNHYDPKTGVLAVGPSYGDWYKTQPQAWKERLAKPAKKGGKAPHQIRNQDELNQLSAFVAWTEWATNAHPRSEHARDNVVQPVSAAALPPP